MDLRGWDVITHLYKHFKHYNIDVIKNQSDGDSCLWQTDLSGSYLEVPLPSLKHDHDFVQMKGDVFD